MVSIPYSSMEAGILKRNLTAAKKHVSAET